MELTGPAGNADEAEDAADLFRVIGRQLRLLRERVGFTQRELGDRLGYSEDLIRSVECGRRTPRPELLDAADDLLGAGGLLRAAKEDLERAKTRARVRHPTWFKDYARLEREAVELHDYSSLALPGLLQTEDHARAVFTSRQPLLPDDVVEQRVIARLERQEILTRWPPPLTTFTIEESVLRRPIGGRAVHREQLRRLLETAALRSVELHVMPTERPEHPSLGGPFILLTPKGRHQVGYLEIQNTSKLVTDPEEVRILAARYGSIRGQALNPRESLTLVEKTLGEL
ncbi:helix-turn-helix transcriptional regulator [Streptomyces sp. GC420]|uniref:helix-turn-helix domain-containing protein n=1 Tax=Streptomyces sp. GC420 TaxID=2697568 RepID=UPI001414D99D|nr:helix-turn-helix transcriptional regulator [Streptomyces sp. GC420]NBM19674.1 helix-turn-helix domain-containing protein [Streptomyces sp. GC420]